MGCASSGPPPIPEPNKTEVEVDDGHASLALTTSLAPSKTEPVPIITRALSDKTDTVKLLKQASVKIPVSKQTSVKNTLAKQQSAKSTFSQTNSLSEDAINTAMADVAPAGVKSVYVVDAFLNLEIELTIHRDEQLPEHTKLKDGLQSAFPCSSRS